MLDIEFLTKKKPVFGGILIYTYTTGVLKHDIRLKVEEIYPDKESSISEGSLSSSLFSEGTIHILNWNESEPPQFSLSKEDRMILYIPKDIYENNQSNYFGFSEKGTLIEEEPISKVNMNKVLKYLISSSIWVDSNRMDVTLLKDSVREYILRHNLSMGKAITFFEHVAVLCVKNNQFDPSIFRRVFSEPSEVDILTQIAKSLCSFLKNPSDEYKDKLISDLRVYKKHGVEEEVLNQNLSKILRDMLRVNVKTGGLETRPLDIPLPLWGVLKEFKEIPPMNILKVSTRFSERMGKYTSKTGKYLINLSMVLEKTYN